VLFDRSKNRFDSNTAFVPAGWRIEYEDRWTFDGNANEFTVLLRWANWNDKLDTTTDVVFEMISYINRKGRLIAVSCSYASISMVNLKQGRHFLEIKGG
jgi:hypothetical protein